MIADALSKRRASLEAIFLEWKQLVYITGYDVRPKCELDSETLVSLTIRSIWIEWNSSSQRNDPNLLEIASRIKMGIDGERTTVLGK